MSSFAQSFEVGTVYFGVLAGAGHSMAEDESLHTYLFGACGIYPPVSPGIW